MYIPECYFVINGTGEKKATGFGCARGFENHLFRRLSTNRRTPRRQIDLASILAVLRNSLFVLICHEALAPFQNHERKIKAPGVYHEPLMAVKMAPAWLI